MPKISTKAVSRERLVFLRSSEKTYDVIAGAERYKRTVKQPESGCRKFRVKVVGSNESNEQKLHQNHFDAFGQNSVCVSAGER